METATNTTAKAAIPPVARSRVTNRSKAFLGADGRTAVARRWRDVYAALTEDLGGESHVSEAERQLARRAATLVVTAELAEAAMAAGGECDSESYCRLVNALSRVLSKLGLKRHATQPPRLAELLNQGKSA